MANPSLSRQFTLTNFTWKLRANGHLNGEKIGAVNYLKLSRIPSDIRIYWNSTNNRDTAFSVDELVRGFKINERDEAGNAKTLDNVWLWSEGEIPIEPLSDIIEIEYNGAGDLIEPLLGNKSGAIDKIEKVQVVSAIDKVLNPIKVVQQKNTLNYNVKDFYRINGNVRRPLLIKKMLRVDYGEKANLITEENSYTNFFDITGYYDGGDYKGFYQNTAWGGYSLHSWLGTSTLCHNNGLTIREFAKNCIKKDGTLGNFRIGLRGSLQTDGSNYSSVYRARDIIDSEGLFYWSEGTVDYYSTNIGFPYPLNVMFFPNNVFEKFIKIEDYKEDISEYTMCYGLGSLTPIQNEILAVTNWETTYDENLSLYIFDTLNYVSYIAPVQSNACFISLIAENNIKKADFRIALRELNKTSGQDCFLYVGGFDGIKMPIKAGFELCFNNKKSGMDYAIIEIPAGDIYKIELELLNVYEDFNDA